MSKANRIDYVEFSTTDMDQTKSFYRSVFDWSFQDWGPEYAGFDDGKTRGGFQKVDQLKSGGPLVVLYAEDLSEVADKVKAAGGKIVRDVFEFPGGRRFHFEDPTGNLLAVWSEK